MEIEAKFIVKDRTIFDDLKRTVSIEGFTTSDAVTSEFRDTYLDTLDMAIYACGFSFRCREKKDKVVYTLKSLKGTGSLIHMRQEIELSMKEKAPVHKWEDCSLKDHILDMIGAGSLSPLFMVDHKRTDIQLSDEQRHIAELSFDDVDIVCDNNNKSYLEIEAELMGDGNEAELQRIAHFFIDEAGLTPGSSSKFDNGLELFIENIRQEAMLIDYGQKCSSEGISFLPIGEIFDEYDIEREHARRVAENALQLFDALKTVHLMDDKLRQTLRFAALVHDIGVMTDISKHHKVGRDILLSSCPQELPCPLCLFLPWTTFLHKKSINRMKLQKLSMKKRFSGLPVKMQDDILKMSAILRIADALDYSRMKTKITHIDLLTEEIVIKVKGPGADIDADRADTKADLWRLLFERDLYLRKD